MKILAINKDGKHSVTFNSVSEAIRKLNSTEKDVKNALLHGHEVLNVETGEVWYLDELFVND